MTRGPRRVLFVFAWLVVGGEETEVRLLARLLDPARYRLEVLACHRRPGMPDQTEQQLRLTVEALKERQEHELINNREFGLLNNCEYDQRLQPHDGVPSPDDMDELLSRRRGTKLFLAHPRAISAFGRELNRFDECVVDHALAALRQNNYRPSVLVEEIATSYPFRHRFYPKQD